MKLRSCLLLLVVVILCACNQSRAGAASAGASAAPPAPRAGQTKGQPQSKPKSTPKSKPAANAEAGAEAAPPARAMPHYTNYFDSARAWQDMRDQLDFGFRVAGTPSANKCRGFLIGQLKQSCASVDSQLFSVKRPGGELRMCNIIGHINPQAPRRILLVAHWDTRPSADMNPPGMRNQPIAGADDGASETAVLLELARVFKDHPPKIGVDILLTDGEDFGPSMTMMFLGAKYFADQLTPAQVSSYNYGILLDMIGDSALDLHPEAISQPVAGRVYAEAVEISRDLGYKAFKQNGGYEIYDDHLPLIEKGLRVYDFIDFNYRYWHTTEDTLDKCSPDSLEAVGRTVENLIYLVPNLYDETEPLGASTIGSGWR